MTEIVRISFRKIELEETDPFNNFCSLAGVCSNLDKERIAMQIIKLLHRHNGLTSTELSNLVGKSRGAILNQLQNLYEKRLIFKYGKIYYLREKSFSLLVTLIEQDLKQTINRMKEYAEELDELFSE